MNVVAPTHQIVPPNPVPGGIVVTNNQPAPPGGTTTTTVTTGGGTPPATTTSSNLLYWILGIAGVAAVGLYAYYAFKKKPATAAMESYAAENPMRRGRGGYNYYFVRSTGQRDRWLRRKAIRTHMQVYARGRNGEARWMPAAQFLALRRKRRGR